MGGPRGVFGTVLMGTARAAVGWLGGRLLLNLLITAVVLDVGRLGVDPINGMPASALAGGTVAAMPASPARGKNRGNGKGRLSLDTSCVLPV